MMLRVTTILLIALVLATLSQAQPSLPNGERIYTALHQHGLLEDYLKKIANSVVDDLIQASGRWSHWRINQPYDPGVVNIYLINSHKFDDSRNPLAGTGVKLRQHDLLDNATTLETVKLIFIDTGLLKSLVAVAMLNDTRSMETWDAVATVRAYGLNTFAHLWDPVRNPQLRLPDPTAKWFIYYRGALAFIIGHELGHMALGPGTFSKRSPVPLKGEDRKLYHACPALVDPAYRERQRYESEADDFAVDLISRVCGQLTPAQPRRFRYELGARWYFVVGMGQSLIYALPMTENRVMQAYIKMDLGSELYRDVLAAAEAEKRWGKDGRIPGFFPPSHPPDHQRAAEALGRLTHSRCSYFYGQSHPAPLLQQTMNTMLQKTCQDIASRYKRP